MHVCACVCLSTPGPSARSPPVLSHDDGGVGQSFTHSCQKGSRTIGGAFLMTLLCHQETSMTPVKHSWRFMSA